MLSRRAFTGFVAGLPLSGLGLRAAGAAAEVRAAKPVPKPAIKPRKLSPGDTIGMILPATLEFR